MDHLCVVFPALPGKIEEDRAFQRELDTERKASTTNRSGASALERNTGSSPPAVW